MREQKAASHLKLIWPGFRCSFTLELAWLWVRACVWEISKQQDFSKISMQKVNEAMKIGGCCEQIPVHGWTVFSVWEWDLSPPERGHLCQASSLRLANLTHTRSWHRTPRRNQSQPCSSLGSKGTGVQKSVLPNTQTQRQRRRGTKKLRGWLQRPIKPLFCTQALDVFLPMLCSCDSACKYLGGSQTRKEQRPLCTAGGKQNVSKQARDVAGSLSKCLGREKPKTKRHFFFLREGTASSLSGPVQIIIWVLVQTASTTRGSVLLSQALEKRSITPTRHIVICKGFPCSPLGTSSCDRGSK